MSTTVQVRDPKDYVPADVWAREIALLTRDYPFDEVMANRLFGQAVAYLVTCFETYHGDALELGAGELVDTAVHAFILDTRNYAEFCDRHFGQFLHHVPEIERKCDGTVKRTAEVIASRGFAVDWPLWEHDYAKCSPCAAGTKCH